MKRVLVGAIHHESNSFNPIIATEEDFAVLKGEKLFENIRENDSLSGVIVTLKNAGYEVIPTVSARAVPNGLVDYDFYMNTKNEIIDRAKKANEEKPLDAICLSLHGSMRIKDFGEAEGPLLSELRELFPDIPIYSSLDMHTTMTKMMHDNCDGFVGYKCAPHTDCTETGEHAAKMTIEALEDGVIGKSAWVKVPILVAGEKSATTTEPMISLINALREVEKREGIMAASYLMGFPWADNEDSSVAVHVVARDDQKLADDVAVELAKLIWSKRYDFDFETDDVYHNEEALDKAFEAVKKGVKPVYISDSGDNPTAGASSDNTEFLKLIIEDERAMNLDMPIIYGGFYDPIATKKCENKVGEEITLTFGAHFDKVGSSPIEIKGIVKSYIKDWTKFKFPKGDIAVFSAGGVDIIIAEQHIGYTDPELYRDLGLKPDEANIIICKLGYLTPGHKAISKRSIMALTKGNTNEDLKSIDYKLVKRPIFPLDEDFEYNAKDYLIRKESE
ncbi:MAG: M81 family metallopeptidase [Tissierellia bacterium]|nr:M81 family metallopeptidase [Tissierellia bacterium]